MGVEVLESTLEVEEATAEERFEEEPTKSPKTDVDARRRLEDKLEQIRLQKALREYDFDL